MALCSLNFKGETLPFALFALVCAFLIEIGSANGQNRPAALPTPIIDTANVGWGWFDLTLNTSGVTPAATRWIITSANRADTLLDKNCWRCAGNTDVTCPGDLYADVFDKLLKRITGCMPDTEYVATALYNDGSSWSAQSNEIHFRTLPEPSYSITDTLFIIIWGHSFAAYGPDCSVLADIRFAGDFSNPYNNFGQAIQTEMRRALKKPVVVINNASGGTNQFDWIHNDNDTVEAIYRGKQGGYEYLDSTYFPGHTYADHKRYPIAVFFFGDNDAANQYPDTAYAHDIRTILDSLTNRGVKVVYNSIHYTTAPDYSTALDYSTPAAEEAYYAQWNKVMAEYYKAPLVWKDFDYYQSFKSNPTRFLGLDHIHPDFSEGIFEIAREVAPILIDAALGHHAVVGVASATTPQLRFAAYPNPTFQTIALSYELRNASRIELTIEDALGRIVARPFSGITVQRHYRGR